MGQKESRPTSERLWTIALDGDPIRLADGQTEFHFPAPKAGVATTVYQSYNDMNLATLPEPQVRIGPTNATGKLADEFLLGRAGHLADHARRGARRRRLRLLRVKKRRGETVGRPNRARPLPHAARGRRLLGHRPPAPPAHQPAHPSPGAAARRSCSRTSSACSKRASAPKAGAMSESRSARRGGEVAALCDVMNHRLNCSNQ